MHQTDSNKHFSGLRGKLVRLITIPLLITGVVIIICGYNVFFGIMSNQVQNELQCTAQALLYNYEDLFADEMSFETAEDGRYILNGDLSKTSTFMDYMAGKSGIESSIFYYDIRILSTLMDENGVSIAGTAISNYVTSRVFETKEPHFFNNTSINNEQYYAYYMPVLNDSGECIGMIATCKPTADIKVEARKGILPYIAIILFMMFVVGCIGSAEAGKLAVIINKEKQFLGDIAKGNLRADLDANILKRNDELGEMGAFTVKVQKFIRDMIERDTLTKLYTRRIGISRIENTIKEYTEYGVKYCIVMCDIDHFKRFNDTYGHDCGDLVLMGVADVFLQELTGAGYAIRWGGEEFILILENKELAEARLLLEKIRNAVKNKEVEYNGEKLRVTMTYGITSGDDRDMNQIIKEVDELLYVGKEGGRDRIVGKEDV